MRSPWRVTVFSPSSYTGATGRSPVPGRLMPMLACLLSPGPFTTQPITATVMSSTAVRAPRVRRGKGEVRLDACGKLLEVAAGGTAAARTRHDQRRERAQPHGLQDLLGHDDFLSAVPPGIGC